MLQNSSSREWTDTQKKQDTDTEKQLWKSENANKNISADKSLPLFLLKKMVGQHSKLNLKSSNKHLWYEKKKSKTEIQKLRTEMSKQTTEKRNATRAELEKKQKNVHFFQIDCAECISPQ